VPMKRLFTLITILITLSLIGIIVLQLSWIKNSLLLKEDQTIQAIDAAVYELSQDLIEEKSKLPTLISPKMIQDWPKERLLDLFKVPTIAERYTAFKMQDKIRKSLERHGLKKTSFEFAIVNAVNSLTFEMQSGNFERAYEHALEDTANNRIYYLDITPLPGSETESLVPSESVVVVFPEIQNFIFSSLGWMIAGAILFTLIILAAFYITVRALLRQKKLSEIKSDFINNMTHELKTPLATISLAVDAIRNPKVVNDPEKLYYFSNIIKDENKRMNKQVETILQAALLDKQEVQLRLKELNVHDILAHIAENFKLQMDERKGKLVIEPEAQNDLIEGDDVHITNMLSNLVDNAIKYSKEDVPPVITISTMNYGKYLRVRLEDNGIGMNKETVSRIFEKFYRAHTGNIHNVKGFGLGLSYVRTMVDAHHGKIKVESVPGKGSVFTVDLPNTGI
jgi:two-component system, OmpR family, phosphate regulon sensor histidine kinase PhoR